MSLTNYTDTIWQQIQNDGVTDSKGLWQITGIRREKVNEFIIWLWFTPAAGLKLAKTQPWATQCLVYAWSDTTINRLKSSIRKEAGYTPAATTLQRLFDQLEAMRSAFQEEDRRAALGDPAAAQRQLDLLLQTALNRYRQQESFPPAYRAQRQTAFDRYLSAKEQEEVRECLYMINGSTFAESDSRFGGLTLPFRQQLDDEIRELKFQAEARAAAVTAARQRALLETDPTFRRLAAQILQARGSETELTYRLFGYRQSLDDYRDALQQLDDLLAPYGCNSLTLYRLAAVIRKYVAEGNLLPAVQPVYERQPGQLYYYDHINTNGRSCQVLQVGRRYVYTDAGRFPLSAVQLNAAQ